MEIEVASYNTGVEVFYRIYYNPTTNTLTSVVENERTKYALNPDLFLDEQIEAVEDIIFNRI
jgi:hypothetical protein